MSAKYKFHLSGARFYQFVVMLMVCFCFFQSKAQWAFVGSPESCDPISFDSEGDTLVVITTGGLFYSQNTGTTWHAIKTPRTGILMQIVSMSSIGLMIGVRHG